MGGGGGVNFPLQAPPPPLATLVQYIKTTTNAEDLDRPKCKNTYHVLLSLSTKTTLFALYMKF